MTRPKHTLEILCDLVGLFVIKFLILLPVMLLIGLVYDPPNQVQASLADRFSLPMMFLVAVVILPLVEEIGFRLSLKFKPAYLAMSIAVFAYYVLTKGVYETKISMVDDSFVVRLVAASLIGLSVYLFAGIGNVKSILKLIWQKHFRWIYYISCVVFAAIHIFKYEMIWINIVLLPILTLPQLMSGMIYGYVRVTFGFQYNLLFHMFTNLLAISLSLL